MKLRRQTRISSEISTVSMADIAFLLIIFFMLTTVFEVERVADVNVPRMRAGHGKPKQNIHVTITPDERVQIGEEFVDFYQIQPIVRQRLVENPKAVVILRGDEVVPYRFVMDVIDELKQAGVDKLALATKEE